MTGDTLPVSVQASIPYEPVPDVDGHIVLLPTQWWQRVMANYRGPELVLRLPIPRPAVLVADGLTNKAAALLLADDLGVSFETARVAVSRACAAGDVASSGTGRTRRIDRTSFDAWRLRRRDAELDRIDGDKPEND